MPQLDSVSLLSIQASIATSEGTSISDNGLREFCSHSNTVQKSKKVLLKILVKIPVHIFVKIPA